MPGYVRNRRTPHLQHIPWLMQHPSLEQYARALHFDERKHLLRILTSLNDPLFVLPIEIVLQVFGFLPLFSTWNLRRISRRWRDLLSSEDFIRAAVSRWTTHDDSDSARSSQQTAAASLTSRVQHLQALCTGRPIYEATFDAVAPDNPPHAIVAPIIALKGFRIAYILKTSRLCSEGDAVIVRNLVTGNKRTLRGFARESVMDVLLTTSLVAWTTLDGSLYVLYHDRSLSEIERVQLPSSLITTAAADGEAIAIIMRSTQPLNAQKSDVILYQARSKSLQSFGLLPQFGAFVGQERSTSLAMMLESDKSVINIFATKTTSQQGSNEPQTREVSLIQISFRGESLHTTSWPLVVDVPDQIKLYSVNLEHCRPTGYKGEFILRAHATGRGKRTLVASQHTTVLNMELGRGSAQENTEWLLPSEPCDLIPRELVWKGRRHRPSAPESRYMLDCAMNDSFLVILEAPLETHKKPPEMTRHMIRVLCYDPDIKVVGWEKTTVV